MNTVFSFSDYTWIGFVIVITIIYVLFTLNYPNTTRNKNICYMDVTIPYMQTGKKQELQHAMPILLVHKDMRTKTIKK